MPQSPAISFVTWPDGKVDERSLTVAGERIARERFIAAFLPQEYFGAGAVGFAADQLWRSAQDKGCRSYTITVGKDGQPKLSD